MPDHLRALLILMVLSLGYFYAARGALSQLLPDEIFKRWRNLWLLATLMLFLSHSIWLFMLALGTVLLVTRRREAHVMGLYFALLFVAPPMQAVIPGFGIIEHLWVLEHYRLLGLTLLLPAALSLLQRPSTLRLGSSPVDWMILCYVVLLSLLAFREGNVSSGLRAVISHWVDIFLPYYVASRSLRNEEGFRHAMAGFLMAAMVMVPIAVFEMVRGWKLYEGAVWALGGSSNMFGWYLYRGGLLRPSVTAVSSIVLGYIFIVGLGFLFYLKEFLEKPLHRRMGLAAMAVGIVASLSRGPWVGALVLLVIYLLSGPRPIRRLAGAVLIVLVMFPLLSQFEIGQKFIDMMPIIGSIEQENIDYRADLLTAAGPVIERHFWLGSYDFLEAPELQVMIQGDGIIDVVNTYVGVILYSGAIGLVFFVGAFLGALLELRRGMRAARRQDPRILLLGRAQFATLVTVMVVIYTVSSITAVPVVYWPLLGLAVAYGHFTKNMGNSSPAGRVL